MKYHKTLIKLSDIKNYFDEDRISLSSSSIKLYTDAVKYEEELADFLLDKGYQEVEMLDETELMDWADNAWSRVHGKDSK
jgi:hypothetical protein